MQCVYCWCVTHGSPVWTTCHYQTPLMRSRKSSWGQSGSLAVGTHTKTHERLFTTLSDQIMYSFIFKQTCRCLRVKMTGSERYTLLEPLCTEAEMTWELTTRVLRLTSEPWPSPSPSRRVEFWVVRKEPKFLQRERTSFTWPAEKTTEGIDTEKRWTEISVFVLFLLIYAYKMRRLDVNHKLIKSSHTIVAVLLQSHS